MSNIILNDKFKIEDMIYEIRGKQVMLDSDLAKLYECTNGTLKNKENLRGQHVKYLPYVFTEQGVAMLASVLRTSVASEVSIKIMRAFVLMKQYISNNLLEQKYINDLVLKDSKRIDLIESVLSEFKEKNNHLFFEGQIYDAYSLLIDIFN